MKNYLQTSKNTGGWPLALATVFAAGQLAMAAADQTSHSGSGTVTFAASSSGSAAAGSGAASGQERVVINPIKPGVHKDLPWLGVAIEEASEALASQLGLDPGGGLVVTYVTPDSPAAKAGLQKNDVLAEFENQSLVHPAQLRKLVQARKEGQTVNLVFYRTGKKQTASVTLAKTPAGFASLDDEHAWTGSSPDFRLFWHGPGGDPFRGSLKTLRDASGRLKIDQQKLQEEVKRSMDEARKAYDEALRRSTNGNWALGPAAKALKDLRRSRITLDENATVTVRNTGQGVKSIVQTDDSGTVVIVSNPKPHLTAHDKDGKLLFDGEIDTSEQRDTVPRDLWGKVEPLLDKLAPKAEDEPGAAAAPSKPAPPRSPRPPTPPSPRKTPTV